MNLAGFHSGVDRTPAHPGELRRALRRNHPDLAAAGRAPAQGNVPGCPSVQDNACFRFAGHFGRPDSACSLQVLASGNVEARYVVLSSCRRFSKQHAGLSPKSPLQWPPFPSKIAIIGPGIIPAQVSDAVVLQRGNVESL